VDEFTTEGLEYLSEILFKECSHYCELISNPKQFGRVLQSAMQNAVGLGGVGVIVLPGEVAGAEMPPDGARSVTSQLPSARPGEKELAQLAELINSSKKIALFYGIRCADDAIHDCDLLLLLGADFPHDKFLHTKHKIVQVDIWVGHLGRRSKLDLGIWGDVRETIRALLQMVDAKADRSVLLGRDD